ncbi:MAG: aminopeptidase [Calditrichaeota bacterium]|nr:MAG: aminopeptidase [Calditrichota bacterium]
MRTLRNFVKFFVPVCLLFFSLTHLNANSDEKKDSEDKKDGFQFTPVIELQCTPVKNQARTGTCWSFATTSFVEAELMRMKKGSLDLSEMFNVRHTYPLKARNYVRLHGNATLGQGSLFQDALRVISQQGFVPESAYSGQVIDEKHHNHSELFTGLNGFLDSIIKTRKLTPVWPQAVESLLDTYLGPLPGEFTYEGKKYTAKSFAEKTGFNPGDYVELTSYTHHPFYSQFALEIPDNWARNQSHNVPLDELVDVLENALERGYTVGWDGDTSERSFIHKKGVAFLPLKEWDDRTKEERNTIGDAPEAEKDVTQSMRQRYFDNYTSKDDHLMHITGIAKDQNGTKYYITKNSWGEKESKYDGFLHMSESYVRAKTVSILVHKDAIPDNLMKKLNFK